MLNKCKLFASSATKAVWTFGLRKETTFKIKSFILTRSAQDVA